MQKVVTIQNMYGLLKQNVKYYEENKLISRKKLKKLEKLKALSS